MLKYISALRNHPEITFFITKNHKSLPFGFTYIAPNSEDVPISFDPNQHNITQIIENKSANHLYLLMK